MARPRKPLISKRKTLEAALRIIDQEGLAALSIRRLGRELNVQGISLYHHFESKEDILAGVCQLALSNVRTPKTADLPWREWLLQNAIEYRRALQAHPNLTPALMRRHPLRIGLAEHNATAGLLAVQGVPLDAIMPLMEALEIIALGSANYQSAVENDEQSDAWQEAYPFLYHLSQRHIDRDRLFEIMARAIVDSIALEFDAEQDASSAISA